jgi:hypothetical protein
MEMLPSAIKRVIANNRKALAATLDGFRQPEPDIYLLTMQIELIAASLLTLESLIPAPEPEEVTRKMPADRVRNTAEEGVEDDNPDAELPDEKKNRIESRGFYG